MREKVGLTGISIKGFKSYGDVSDGVITLSDEVNIIIGANGVGKSNFVSFLEMIGYIASDGFVDYVAKNGFSKSIVHFGPKNTRILEGVLQFRVEKKGYLFI